VMVTQNTTDINYLLRVVGTLLKTNEETSGHSSVEGATGATGAVARALVTPHNLTSDTSDPDFKLTSEGFGSNAGYPIWKAFDNLFDGSSFALVSYGYDMSTCEAESTFTFNPGTGAINGSWIKITLNETKSFNTFKFAAHSIPVMGPSSYTIYGSNDAITYTSFYSNVNYYPVGASGSYEPAVSFATQEWRYIVLLVTKIVGPGTACSLMEIDFSMV